MAPQPSQQPASPLTPPAPLPSATAAAAPRRVRVVCPAKLGDTSLFGSSTSSLLSGGSAGEAAAAAAAASTAEKEPSLDEIDITSEAGIDYSPLRDALKEGDFKKADDQHRILLIKLAGEGAVKRGWVYFSEAKNMPVKDLQVMDNLWRAGSKGRFGFTPQREIYNQQQKQWARFFKRINWTTLTEKESVVYRKWPGEFTYSLDAPKGHLPLTNALRGTQLLQALLEHPAFEKASTKKSIDDVTKQQTASTNKLF